MMISFRVIRVAVFTCLALSGLAFSQAPPPAPAAGGGAASPTFPTFGARLDAGKSTVTVNVTASSAVPATISIYEFDPSYGLTTCGNDQMAMGTPLQIVSSPGSSNTTQTISDSITTSGLTVLTISQPLVAGSALCLVDTHPTPWSWNPTPQVVSDPNDFGRFRTYFTIGVQASNQLSSTSTNSSTAGEYLEAGFDSTYLRAAAHRPGLATNFDVRLSPIPVAGTSTTTTVSNGISTSSIAANQLSSQDSVRLVGSVYAPVKVSGWSNGGGASSSTYKENYFTLAPIARAGVGTLINPSTTSSTGSATSNQTVTTTQFASSFNFWGLGGRIAWERYAPDSNKGPQTLTQFAVVVGDDSNLPSYVCKPGTSPTPLPAVTACTTGEYLSRTLRPRVDIEGFVKLPNYPFILGFDANLQQYALWKKPNLDYLNKPGNDIRIYVGISVDIATLVSKL
jgi:hypothetical protein